MYTIGNRCVLVLILIIFNSLICIAQYDDEIYKPAAAEYHHFDNGQLYDVYGYFYTFDMSFNLDDFGEAENGGLAAAHISSDLGWRFNSKFALAGGLGFEFNETELAGFRIDTQFLTTYLKARYYFLSTRYRPYVYGRLGYGFGPPDENVSDHGDGINYQIGISMLFPNSNKYKYAVGLYWHQQIASGQESYIDPFGNEINTVYDLIINRLMLKIAIDVN